jgi:iron complex transport system ATP-binding protein
VVTDGVPVLVARALVAGYPTGEPVLTGVDLTLEPGELVCVLGTNGAGKSCLLKTLGGLIPVRGGSVTIRGRALASLAPRARAREVASVPQGLRALPDTDVLTFVLGGRYAHLGMLARGAPHDRAVARAALAQADARELETRALHELSGGQLQRVLVARALAQQAPVLLFDEPTASLDPEHQVGLLATIRRLVAGGHCALVATHELALASRFATRVVLLADGGVRTAGSPTEVLRREVLEPVYGPHLLYAREPGPLGRPVVVPWPSDDAGAPR